MKLVSSSSSSTLFFIIFSIFFGSLPIIYAHIYRERPKSCQIARYNPKTHSVHLMCKNEHNLYDWSSVHFCDYLKMKEVQWNSTHRAVTGKTRLSKNAANVFQVYLTGRVSDYYDWFNQDHSCDFAHNFFFFSASTTTSAPPPPPSSSSSSSQPYFLRRNDKTDMITFTYILPLACEYQHVAVTAFAPRYTDLCYDWDVEPTYSQPTSKAIQRYKAKQEIISPPPVYDPFFPNWNNDHFWEDKIPLSKKR